MNREINQEILQQVIKCFRTGTAASPFGASKLTDTDAYAVQYQLIERLKSLGEVVRGHKIALTDIALGEDILKYGFPIGRPVPRWSQS